MLTSWKLLLDIDLFECCNLLLLRLASTLFSSLIGSIDDFSIVVFLNKLDFLLLFSLISFTL